MSWECNEDITTYKDQLCQVKPAAGWQCTKNIKPAICKKGFGWEWENGNYNSFTCTCIDENICGPPVTPWTIPTLSPTTTASTEPEMYGTCNDKPAPVEGAEEWGFDWDCSENKKYGWMCSLKKVVDTSANFKPEYYPKQPCRGKPVICVNGVWQPRKSGWQYPVCENPKYYLM